MKPIGALLPNFFDDLVARQESALVQLYRTLAARFGWAFVWRNAHWLLYGESLPVRERERRAA